MFLFNLSALTTNRLEAIEALSDLKASGFSHELYCFVTQTTGEKIELIKEINCMDTQKFGLLKGDYLCYSAGCVVVNSSVVFGGRELGWAGFRCRVSAS